MSSVSAVIPATDNYCKVGTCTFCKKSAGGAKSCDSCKISIKSLVEVGTADVFKCEKGSIANCSEYNGVDSEQNTGCAGCEDGYKTKESGQVNGKKNFICEKIEGTRTPKIQNCETDNYYWHSQASVGKVRCTKCNKGFTYTYNSSNNDVSCEANDATANVANCEAYNKSSGTTRCNYCVSGYINDYSTGVCNLWGVHVGCDNLSSDKTKCQGCQTDRLSYYAVDVSDTVGQICKYESSLVKLMAGLVFGLVILL
jgi:hypothetical protein